MESIAFQTEFRPALPVVFGAKDYREFRATFEEMNHLLTVIGIENRMLVRCLSSSIESHQIKHIHPPPCKRIRSAPHYSILLALTGPYHQALSQVVVSVLF